MTPWLLDLCRQCYRELRPRAAMPEFQVEFFRFANLNNTIRLRDSRVLVRISDLLEGAPPAVVRAILHILLAKLYRKPIEPVHVLRYRRYIGSYDIAAKTHLIRQLRGRKRLTTPRGHVYDLEAIFEELNLLYFHGLLARPLMSWSETRSRNSLGHYDPAHNTIVVSRVFDRPGVPRYAVEYLVYHEMLHLKHPVKLRGARRCYHSREFQQEEKLFPHWRQAQKFLKTL